MLKVGAVSSEGIFSFGSVIVWSFLIDWSFNAFLSLKSLFSCWEMGNYIAFIVPLNKKKRNQWIDFSIELPQKLLHLSPNHLHIWLAKKWIRKCKGVKEEESEIKNSRAWIILLLKHSDTLWSKTLSSPTIPKNSIYLISLTS